MSTNSKFPGFPKGALTFYRGLAKNNQKGWFEDHKSDYTDSVLEPAKKFVERLGEKLQSVHPEVQASTKTNGSGSIMRIYRDTRFSKDKTPYKTWLGVVFWIGAGKKTELPGFYFHMDPASTHLYGGQHTFPKDALERYRRAVDRDKSGKALEKILSSLRRIKGYEISEPHYKRVPRGYDPEHPRADLLRHAGLSVRTAKIPNDVVTSSKLEAECLKHWKKMAPLVEWLSDL